MPPDESVTASTPEIACCTKFKLLLVLSPQVPAFSPVTMSSNLRSLENDDAIKISPYNNVNFTLTMQPNQPLSNYYLLQDLSPAKVLPLYFL